MDRSNRVSPSIENLAAYAAQEIVVWPHDDTQKLSYAVLVGVSAVFGAKIDPKRILSGDWITWEGMGRRIASALAWAEITEPNVPISTPSYTQFHDEPIDLNGDFH